MDRIECYLSGVVIASGYITEFSDIVCEGDDFEMVQHMFQTSLNSIYPVCDKQLHMARRKIQRLLPQCRPHDTQTLLKDNSNGSLLYLLEADYT